MGWSRSLGNRTTVRKGVRGVLERLMGRFLGIGGLIPCDVSSHLPKLMGRNTPKCGIGARFWRGVCFIYLDISILCVCVLSEDIHGPKG